MRRRSSVSLRRISSTTSWEGRTRFHALWSAFQEGFPSLHFRINDLIAEEDRVAARLTITGVHGGPFSGVRATGRPIEIDGFVCFRIRSGKIVERWAVLDEFRLLQQIGVLPGGPRRTSVRARREERLMATVRGTIVDRASGRPLEARVRVISSTGNSVIPREAVLKVGGGEPFFYADRSFAVDVPRGQVDIVVERGTEYRSLRRTLWVHGKETNDLDLPLERWAEPAARGWYAGNTHVHYSEKETAPEARLRLDPRVEDLPVLIVSILKRRDLPYASNAFPIGRHPLSTHEHVIDVGEESRHNDEPWRIGLGHIMLVNIRNLVEPVSRGILVDDSSPDYPPLVDACDAARAQGGTVIWCHNANGMEAPIAAALGRLHALNLFDPYWMDPEYELWYALLNCGIRLPASTGSDWFVCSANRVYVDVGASFSYENWLARLREGRTTVTNGPLLRLSVEGAAPSNDLLGLRGDRRASIALEWESAQPIDRIEIIRDGEVCATIAPESDSGTNAWRIAHANTGVNVKVSVSMAASVDGGSPAGQLAERGTFRTDLDVPEAGWIAARAWGARRDSYGHAIWAHTSPIYLRARPPAATVRAAADLFLGRLSLATEWLGHGARFDNAAQRARMLQVFAEGRDHFTRLARS
ncbi:MAG: ester cyclase [Chloroflexi bacterium]|nr:ester cyclase [Chloroflexota bacterium]